MNSDQLRKHADAMKKYILSERERIHVNLKKDDDVSKDNLHPKVDLGCSVCGQSPCICDHKGSMTEDSDESVYTFEKELQAVIQKGFGLQDTSKSSKKILMKLHRCLTKLV